MIYCDGNLNKIEKMNFKLDNTSNGIRVLNVFMPSLESSTLTFWIKSGSRMESDKKAGLAHFLEHMAFKGSKNYPSAKHVSEFLDGMGSEYNAGTSYEWIEFYAKVRNESLEKAFRIISDIAMNPVLNPDEMEKERGVILEEISMHEDNPMEKIGHNFGNLIFSGSSLGRDISGTKGTVSKLQVSDLQRYIKSHYVVKNSLITVSGGADSKKVIELSEKYFGELKNPSTTLKASEFRKTQSKPRLKLEFKKTEQAHLILGFLADGRTYKKRFAQAILATILGRGMSSRLFSEVRVKRGLGYAVHTGISRFSDTGVFETYAGVMLEKVEEAIQVILDEHKNLTNAKAPIKKEEIAKAKEYMKGRTALALEDTNNVNDFFGQQALFMPSIETPEEVFAKIDKVTSEEIYEEAKKLFVPAKLNLAVIGPYKNKKRFEKLLK